MSKKFAKREKYNIFAEVILKTIFYLKKRLIPIEDLKRSPVKAVAFFLFIILTQ